MKIKLILFVAVVGFALFGTGCASTEPAFVSDGLVIYYPFNGNTEDESGNENHGDLMGAIPTLDRHGKQNSAYLFDGKNDYIIVGPYDFGETLTSSVWVKPLSLEKHSTIFDNWDGQGDRDIFPYQKSFDLALGADGGVGWNLSEDGDYPHFLSVSPVFKSIDEVRHIVCVKTSNEMKLFIDGKLQKKQSAPKSVFKSTIPLCIGGSIYTLKFSEDLPRVTTVGSHINAVIDDFRIYSRALSNEEVKTIYELEKPKAK